MKLTEVLSRLFIDRESKVKTRFFNHFFFSPSRLEIHFFFFFKEIFRLIIVTCNTRVFVAVNKPLTTGAMIKTGALPRIVPRWETIPTGQSSTTTSESVVRSVLTATHAGLSYSTGIRGFTLLRKTNNCVIYIYVIINRCFFYLRNKGKGNTCRSP